MNVGSVINRDFRRVDESPFVRDVHQLQGDGYPFFYDAIEAQMQQAVNLLYHNPNKELWHVGRSIENMTPSIALAKQRIALGKDSLVDLAGRNSALTMEQWIIGDMREGIPDHLRIKTWDSFIKLVDDLEEHLNILKAIKDDALGEELDLGGRCSIS